MHQIESARAPAQAGYSGEVRHTHPVRSLTPAGLAWSLRHLLGFLALALLTSGTCVHAQASAEEPTAGAQIDQLINVIKDDKEREKLLAQLAILGEAAKGTGEADEAVSSPGANLMQRLSSQVQSSGASTIRALGTLTSLPSALGALATRMGSAETEGIWLGALAKVLIVFLCAVVVEYLARQALRKPREALERTERDGFWSRLMFQFGRLVLAVIGIAAGALAAYAVLSTLSPSATTRLVAIALINATVISRVIGALSRAVLSPQVSGLRLLSMGDETAHYWTVWVRRLSLFAVYGYVCIETGLLLGLSADLHSILSNLLGLGILIMLVVVVQQNRREFAELISADEHSAAPFARFRNRLGELWNVFAVVYLIIVWLIWVSDQPGSFQLIVQGSLATLFILCVAVAVTIALHKLIDKSFRLSDELQTRYPFLESRVNRYVPRIKMIVSAIVFAISIIALFRAWGVDVLAWMQSDVGQLAAERLGSVIFIIVIAMVVWEVASSIIEHLIFRAKQNNDRNARLETLLPLARKTLLVVLSVMVTLTVLSELGVNIGPLLAGAGVVGLAVGFGAQTLVQDIITGVFILVEDSISIGDFIDVGGHSGTVESLSIRTIRLRDVEGNVHTVPFSSVTTVLNYTRDFGISLLEIGIAYREDVDEVIKVLEQLGEEMLEEPDLKKDILEPLVVQGVHSLGDSAVILRARIKTTAGMQWAIRREFYKRMKKRFDELGIEIPFPHQTIYFGVDKDGNAPAAPIRMEAKPD